MSMSIPSVSASLKKVSRTDRSRSRDEQMFRARRGIRHCKCDTYIDDGRRTFVTLLQFAFLLGNEHKETHQFQQISLMKSTSWPGCFPCSSPLYYFLKKRHFGRKTNFFSFFTKRCTVSLSRSVLPAPSRRFALLLHRLW